MGVPFLPTTAEEMRARGWDAVDVVFVTGDAYVDHPSLRDGDPRPRARGGRLPRRDPAAARLEERRRVARVRPAAALLRRQRREHGLDDQPLHGEQEGPQRRRLLARAGGSACGPTARRSSTASAAARRSPACRSIAGGVEASLRRLAHYDYWSRHGPPVDPRSTQGRPARLRHGRGDDRRDRASACAAGRDGAATCATCAAWRTCSGRKEALPAPPLRRRGLRRTTSSCRPSRRSPPTSSRSRRRRAHSTTRRTRSTRAASSQFHATGRLVLNPPALPLAEAEMDAVYDLPYTRRPHPSYTRADPRVRDDQGLGHDHARLLRRLHVLLASRCTRGASSRAAARSRSSREIEQMAARPGLQGHDQRRRRADREHVPDALHAARGRGEVPAALVRPPDDLQAARHRPRPDDRADARRRARCPGVEECLVASRHPHGPRAAVAGVRATSWRAHHVGGHLKVAPEHTEPTRCSTLMKKPAQRQLRDVRARSSARRRARRPARSSTSSRTSSPATRARTSHEMIDLALFLKRNGYRPRPGAGLHPRAVRHRDVHVLHGPRPADA